MCVSCVYHSQVTTGHTYVCSAYDISISHHSCSSSLGHVPSLMVMSQRSRVVGRQSPLGASVVEDCSNRSYFSYRETETEAPSRDVNSFSPLLLLDCCCRAYAHAYTRIRAEPLACLIRCLQRLEIRCARLLHTRTAT